MTRSLLPLLTIVVVLTPAFAQQGPPTAPPASDPAALIEAGKYAEAEQAARARLKDVESTAGRDGAATADVLDVLVESLMRQGEGTDEAKAFAERAVAIRARANPDAAPHARSLNLLANIVELQGDIKGARDLYQRAADIAMRTLGPSDSTTAMMRKDLAIAYRGLGEYQQAKTILEETLAARMKAAPDHVDIGKLQHNLGAVLWEIGEFGAARDAFAAAAERLAAALGPDHPHVASALEGLAVQDVAIGDYAAARAGYERVLAMREKSLGPSHPEVGNTLANLGDVLAAFGDNEAARAVLERAVTIWERALPPDHPVLTVGLTNLGVVLDRLGDHEGGRRALQRAIAIREKTLGPDHAELVVPLIQLANMTADAGALEEARPMYAKARALAEKARNRSHPYVASAAYEEGTRLARAGMLAAARPLLEEAHSIRMHALGANHPSTAESVDALARLAAATGSAMQGRSLALQAESVAREHFRATAAALPERQALLFADQRTRSQDLALRLAARAPERSPAEIVELWDTVVRSRALVLDEMAWRQRTTAAAGDRETRALARQLGDARARLSRLVLDPAAADDVPKTLAAARDEKERLEQALATRSTAYREALAHRAIGLNAIREQVPATSALIGYVRFATAIYERDPASFEYAAFVLRPDRRMSFVSLGPATAIDRAVESWRRRMLEEASSPARGRLRGEQLYRETALALRRRIWDPLAPLVAGAAQVLIVPDGALSLVDFAALPAGSGYLAERGPILHYLSTERDVVQNDAADGAGLLAVGAPAYDDKTNPSAPTRGARDCASAVGPFAALPESGREAAAVAQLWRDRGSSAVVLDGANASERQVKTLAPGKRILHFATHAFFADRRCGRPGPDGADTPLSRTGLALAGANGRAPHSHVEDGKLTAEEITALDLHGVEWAVLSACDTGLGEVRAGEGVLGLRRALLVAGAHTVIMSLWQVDDDIAREWMERAYRARLQRGQPTAAAVRAAEHELLAARRRAGASTHPFYWAGFVAVGDWR